MTNKQSDNSKRSQIRDDDEPINLRTLFSKYAGYWPLFLLSFIISMAGALVYYNYATPVYQIMATLVIQDSNDKPSEEKSSLVEFQQLEQVNAPKVVENELEILKSNQLIKSVVDTFQLWAHYKLKGGIIKNKDLYGINPVKLKLYKPNIPVPSQKIELQILDTNSYSLLGTANKLNKHRFGDTVSNTIGLWTITANNAISQYIGSTIQIGVNDPEATVLGYQNLLTVETQEKPATVINISIGDQNIKRGEDFINYLIYCYKQADIAQKNKIAKNTLAFIDNRLDSLSGQLNHAENNVEGYRSKNGLTDVNAQSQIYLQEIQANGEKLNEINIQLNIIDNLEDYLNQPGSNSTNIPSTAGISDQHLLGLVQKLSDVQLERNKLLATLPEKNPEFEPINNQITTLKLAIKEDIRNIKSSLQTTQQSLQDFKSNYQSSVQNVPVQEHQLAGLSRQQSNKETLYNYLLQEREQISLTYASSASNVRLVDAAHILPLKASKKYIPFGVALLIGLIFPAGFIYGRDLVRNTVNTRRQIEHATSIPVIAEFSFINSVTGIVFNNKGNKDSFILIEQFRHLRTQLNSLRPPGHGGMFTIITSSIANEGKSFISANLAVSVANSGKKTILLEMDIYKPKIAKAFHLQATSGLTDYLTGKADKNEIIQASATYTNLYIIPGGAFIDNFSELLDQEIFKKLLDELRTEYDHILFDAPPIHSINDGYIIAKYCDTTLYLVRYEYTSKSLLPFIEKLSADEKLPNVNIVFNCLTGGRDGEGFKYENYYRG